MNKFEYVKNIKNEGWNKNLDFKKEVALAMLTNSPIQNLTKENVINWLEATDNKAEDYHYDYLALYQLKSRVVFDKKTINKFNREFKSKNIRFREDSFDLMTNPSKNDPNMWRGRTERNLFLQDWHRNTLVMLEKQKYLSIKDIRITKDYSSWSSYQVEADRDIYFRSFQTQRDDGCHFRDVRNSVFVGSIIDTNVEADENNISYKYLAITDSLTDEYSIQSDDYIWTEIEHQDEFKKLNKFFELERVDLFAEHPGQNVFLRNDERFKNLIKLLPAQENETLRRGKELKVLPNN